MCARVVYEVVLDAARFEFVYVMFVFVCVLVCFVYACGVCQRLCDAVWRVLGCVCCWVCVCCDTCVVCL